MPQTPHVEKHFTASEKIRDIVIGMSDGLTVPFALAAGLSGAVDFTRVVITAGLAEIAAGSIAMGLGGYLAARTDAEHYATELAREKRETVEIPEEETREVVELLEEYGLSRKSSIEAAHEMRKDRKRWVDFMMKFELGLEKPDPSRGRTSALTTAPTSPEGSSRLRPTSSSTITVRRSSRRSASRSWRSSHSAGSRAGSR